MKDLPDLLKECKYKELMLLCCLKCEKRVHTESINTKVS